MSIAALSSMVAITHMWTLRLKVDLFKKKIKNSVI